MSGGSRARELLLLLVRSLVDKPDLATIEVEERPGVTVLRVGVDPDDVGKVIGRGGRVIRAVRTLVRAAANLDRERVVVEVDAR